MKLLLAIALVFGSMSAFSAEKTSRVYPQLTVWGHGVDLRIWNTTDKDLRCSGTINIRTQRGMFRTEFYNGIVYRGMTEYRHFSNWNMQDRYLHAYHSIHCYAY